MQEAASGAGSGSLPTLRMASQLAASRLLNASQVIQGRFEQLESSFPGPVLDAGLSAANEAVQGAVRTIQAVLDDAVAAYPSLDPDIFFRNLNNTVLEWYQVATAVVDAAAAVADRPQAAQIVATLQQVAAPLAAALDPDRLLQQLQSRQTALQTPLSFAVPFSSAAMQQAPSGIASQVSNALKQRLPAAQASAAVPAAQAVSAVPASYRAAGTGAAADSGSTNAVDSNAGPAVGAAASEPLPDTFRSANAASGAAIGGVPPAGSTTSAPVAGGSIPGASALAAQLASGVRATRSNLLSNLVPSLQQARFTKLPRVADISNDLTARLKLVANQLAAAAQAAAAVPQAAGTPSAAGGTTASSVPAVALGGGLHSRRLDAINRQLQSIVQNLQASNAS